MTNNRALFFENCRELETKIYNKYPDYIGIFSQVRYYNYLKKFGPFRSTLQKFNYHYLLQSLEGFKTILLLLTKRKEYKKIVFMSGRVDKNGNDRYMKNYVNGAMIWNFSPTPILKGYNFIFLKLLIILISNLPLHNNKINTCKKIFKKGAT